MCNNSQGLDGGQQRAAKWEMTPAVGFDSAIFMFKRQGLIHLADA